MIKLVRNTLGNKWAIDPQQNKIMWEVIKILQFKEMEGLHAGTKLTKAHVNFNDNRMKVKLVKCL
jgi:hypothetical protein